MVTMSRFGSYGRLGNMLFQWASLSSLARKNNTDLLLPDSDIFQYFVTPPKTGSVTADIKVNEPSYEYNPSPYEGLDYSKNIEFLGYWQNEKYFDSQVKKEIKFKPEYKTEVAEKFKEVFSRPTIAIGIRRSDYTETGVYYNLPPLFYITALEKIENWRDYNLVFISDDLAYCKFHYQCLDNAFFPDTKDIEQMCLMSLCDHFIIANSTFHWWAAWLGEKEHSIVIQPNHLFIGKLLQQYGDIDFYSERWQRHEHEGLKLDLSDVTFTIPVYHDSKDRKDNLDICLKLLSEFNTTIIIGEQGTDEFALSPCDTYIKFESKEFHRTKMLNDMARMANTPIIANWDCDVAVPPMQLLETVYKIRKGVEMCYPYEYNFIRLSSKVKDEIKNGYDLGTYAKYNFPNNDSRGKPSFGGAVLWNKQKYFETGGENEYFISFGPEDVERMERAKALGVRIERTRGDLYHFPHWCGPDSSITNPYFKSNRELLNKQRLMSKDELWNYINSWAWHSPYTPDYYDQIVDEAVKSRDEVFRILGIDSNRTIIDCGCGVCQWGFGLGNYIGVDYQVPADKLLVKNYIDADLRLPFVLNKKYEVVLCLEMAEHIEEKYADTLVDNLCSLGDFIIFSAAIPFQGGNNHLNEQWQTYWSEKFYQRGYGGYQLSEIQENENICLWYAQNIVIYKRGALRQVKDFVAPKYYYEIAKHLTKLASK